MAQGWAGNIRPGEAMRCAVCLKQNRSVPAIAMVSGTSVCGEHVDWVSLPLHPPADG